MFNRNADFSTIGDSLDVTQGSTQATLLRKSLEQLRNHSSNSAVKEMADDVLADRISLRDAANVEAYGEAFAEESQNFKEYWDSLSNVEREELAAEGGKLEQEEGISRN